MSFLYFINGPAIPVIMAIGGTVYFGVTFYRANRCVNKYRQERRQEILDACRQENDDNKRNFGTVK